MSENSFFHLEDSYGWQVPSYFKHVKLNDFLTVEHETGYADLVHAVKVLKQQKHSPRQMTFFAKKNIVHQNLDILRKRKCRVESWKKSVLIL